MRRGGGKDTLSAGFQRVVRARKNAATVDKSVENSRNAAAHDNAAARAACATAAVFLRVIASVREAYRPLPVFLRNAGLFAFI